MSNAFLDYVVDRSAEGLSRASELIFEIYIFLHFKKLDFVKILVQFTLFLFQFNFFFKFRRLRWNWEELILLNLLPRFRFFVKRLYLCFCLNSDRCRFTNYNLFFLIFFSQNLLITWRSFEPLFVWDIPKMFCRSLRNCRGGNRAEISRRFWSNFLKRNLFWHQIFYIIRYNLCIRLNTFSSYLSRRCSFWPGWFKTVDGEIRTSFKHFILKILKRLVIIHIFVARIY